MARMQLAPLASASSTRRAMASSRLWISCLVIPFSSPPRIDLSPAPICAPTLRARTVSPKTSPMTSVTSWPGTSFMVEINISSHSLWSGEAHKLVHLLQGGCRGLPRLGGAACQHPLELGGVFAQLAVAALDRLQQCYDGVCHFALELSVAGAFETLLDLGDRLAAGHRHDLDQVRDARLLVQVVDDLAARVGHRALQLLAHDLGRVEQVDRSLWVAAGGGHLVTWLLQIHNPRAGLGVDAPGHREGLAEAGVE